MIPQSQSATSGVLQLDLVSMAVMEAPADQLLELERLAGTYFSLDARDQVGQVLEEKGMGV